MLTVYATLLTAEDVLEPSLNDKHLLSIC